MLAATAFSLLAALSPAAPDDAAKKGPADLQGAWKLTSMQFNGEAADFDLGQIHWSIKDDKIQYAGEEVASLSADSKATPKTIDLRFADKVYEGIYSVEDATLKVCINTKSEGVKERPTDFTTKDKGNLRLLVFRRAKAEEAEAKDAGTGFVGVALRYGEEKKEVTVADVIDGGPAKKAGLKKDDVVLKVGDGDVTTLRSAVDAVRQSKPGKELTFRIRRDGKESDVAVRVAVVPLPLLLQLQ
jgi:uncharacterized protein (TIGR03067 family)